MKKPLRHIADYLILSLIVSLGILLTLIYNGNPDYQRKIIIGLSLIYIVWGIYHHWLEHTLKPIILLEYVMFGVLGMALTIGLL